jgi:hypothetical protein
MKHRATTNFWTTSEINTVKKFFMVWKLGDLARILPRHSPNAIRQRAYKLGMRHEIGQQPVACVEAAA